MLARIQLHTKQEVAKKMKRIDRMTIILSILLLKLGAIYSLLFFIKAEATTIFIISVIGLLLLIFYFFGEIIAVEINELKEKNKQRQIQRKIADEKRKLWQQSLAGFRKIFGGEEHVE